jgi:DNA-binding phage protein
MSLSRSFRTTVRDRADRDPAFRAALYQEAVRAIMEGDLPTAKALLRDYINATVGFTHLGRALGIPVKSLMRMYGPNGNPRADNLLAALARLKADTGLAVQVDAIAVPWQAQPGKPIRDWQRECRTT